MSQTFAVDAAGTIDVETDDDGLHVKAVDANDGWTWKETYSDPDAVTVTFTSGDETLEFAASLSPDGSIDARVDHPVVRVDLSPATTPTPASSAGGGYRPRRRYDDEDEDEHEDDDDARGRGRGRGRARRPRRR